ncbi:hypothetical protein BD410DRAFT_835057 [Rickenella mellea]|uniref:Fe2OG dioxygenase domain-containing protein n=1 Tax=Rickenella mellea TaxID=50990 RepID=A0A4Y7QK61_9AGAM|nr:hypothetical protein BD410DRAFT_835057 [Rickenella mellea]
METQESALHDKLKNAAAECDNPGAWSNGTWQFSPNDLNLFYRSNNDVRFLEWANATAVDLEQLGKLCDPATFGANQQDVLDETYRKAGKMDTDRFSLNMCPERSGLAHVVKMGLLGLRDERSIKLEMYKLNVYGEGSFFKAHKDTPHGDTMFGSLVIVLPSLHQGGALLLKHEGKEVTIDAAKDLDAKPPGTVAWVAFYSDVEHEVEQVVSGHRVTITYNLYFTDSSTLPLPKELLDTENLTEVLRQLLIDEKFLPGGGTIGFGLKHQYPLPSKKTKAKHLKSLLFFFLIRIYSLLGHCPMIEKLYTGLCYGECKLSSV